MQSHAGTAGERAPLIPAGFLALLVLAALAVDQARVLGVAPGAARSRARRSRPTRRRVDRPRRLPHGGRSGDQRGPRARAARRAARSEGPHRPGHRQRRRPGRAPAVRSSRSRWRRRRPRCSPASRRAAGPAPRSERSPRPRSTRSDRAARCAHEPPDWRALRYLSVVYDVYTADRGHCTAGTVRADQEGRRWRRPGGRPTPGGGRSWSRRRRTRPAGRACATRRRSSTGAATPASWSSCTTTADGERAVVITRFCGSRTLLDVASLPADQVAALGASLAQTLADLHQLGVSHGNLLAEHVVLTDDGTPVLCSFADAGVAGPTARRWPPGRSASPWRSPPRSGFDPVGDASALTGLLRHLLAARTDEPLAQREPRQPSCSTPRLPCRSASSPMAWPATPGLAPRRFGGRPPSGPTACRRAGVGTPTIAAPRAAARPSRPTDTPMRPTQSTCRRPRHRRRGSSRRPSAGTSSWRSGSSPTSSSTGRPASSGLNHPGASRPTSPNSPEAGVGCLAVAGLAALALVIGAVTVLVVGGRSDPAPAAPIDTTDGTAAETDDRAGPGRRQPWCRWPPRPCSRSAPIGGSRRERRRRPRARSPRHRRRPHRPSRPAARPPTTTPPASASPPPAAASPTPRATASSSVR